MRAVRARRAPELADGEVRGDGALRVRGARPALEPRRRRARRRGGGDRRERRLGGRRLGGRRLGGRRLGGRRLGGRRLGGRRPAGGASAGGASAGAAGGGTAHRSMGGASRRFRWMSSRPPSAPRRSRRAASYADVSKSVQRHAASSTSGGVAAKPREHRGAPRALVLQHRAGAAAGLGREGVQPLRRVGALAALGDGGEDVEAAVLRRGVVAGEPLGHPDGGAAAGAALAAVGLAADAVRAAPEGVGEDAKVARAKGLHRRAPLLRGPPSKKNLAVDGTRRPARPLLSPRHGRGRLPLRRLLRAHARPHALRAHPLPPLRGAIRAARELPRLPGDGRPAAARRGRRRRHGRRGRGGRRRRAAPRRRARAAAAPRRRRLGEPAGVLGEPLTPREAVGFSLRHHLGPPRGIHVASLTRPPHPHFLQAEDVITHINGRRALTVDYVYRQLSDAIENHAWIACAIMRRPPPAIPPPPP